MRCAALRRLMPKKKTTIRKTSWNALDSPHFSQYFGRWWQIMKKHVKSEAIIAIYCLLLTYCTAKPSSYWNANTSHGIVDMVWPAERFCPAMQISDQYNYSFRNWWLKKKCCYAILNKSSGQAEKLVWPQCERSPRPLICLFKALPTVLLNQDGSNVWYFKTQSSFFHICMSYSENDDAKTQVN